MKLAIDFTRRTMYTDVRESDSVSILCTDRTDGEKYFAEHYPAGQGYLVVDVQEVRN